MYILSFGNAGSEMDDWPIIWFISYACSSGSFSDKSEPYDLITSFSSTFFLASVVVKMVLANFEPCIMLSIFDVLIRLSKVGKPIRASEPYPRSVEISKPWPVLPSVIP